jgi:pyruvyltransferase
MKNKIIYFVPYNGNFGDELVPLLIQRLCGECGCINIRRQKLNKFKGGFMSSLGSIMHLLPDGCHIWGTGHNPSRKRVPKKCKVFATRGPISMQYLNDHGYDLNANDIAFGDPALLIPRLFPKWLEPVDMKHEVTLIPHHKDRNDVANIDDKINIAYCNSGVENIINQIRVSKKIISSSLHGIIVAEMLNKEAVWLQLPKSKKSETDAKYQDYYQSTGRYDVIPAKTLEEAIKMEVAKPIYDDTRLYESFYKCYEYGESVL